MATIIRENIGLLNDKLTVNLAKQDYYNSFEKSLKSYAKTANIQGFRKGMVPAGLIKKMHGQSVFTDEILKTVEKELNSYMEQEHLDIFAQPLPLENDARMLDVNNPQDYVFAFEIGLKPQILIEPEQIEVIFYKVQITDEQINNEVIRLQKQYGTWEEQEEIVNEENRLTAMFTEADNLENNVSNGIEKEVSFPVNYFTSEFQKQIFGKKKNDTLFIQHDAIEENKLQGIAEQLGIDKTDINFSNRFFKITISKIESLKQSDLTTDFFEIVYPGRNISSEEELRNIVKNEIENYYQLQSKNQMHDQIYHSLIDNTAIEFPENFLKRWLQTGSDKPKNEEEVQKEYPTFLNQLKWTLISAQLTTDNKIVVEKEEIKEAAARQLMQYMQVKNLDDTSWINDYINRMIQDEKFVQETYINLQTNKLFVLLESKVKITVEPISADDFANKLHHH